MNQNPDDPHRYDDIIHLPCPAPRRPRMPAESRAAQFAPFAALTGYGDAIRETARRTDRRVELDEDEKARLDARLRVMQAHIRERPEATITYFQPDARKDGGAYLTTTGCVKRVDVVARLLVLVEQKSIPLDDVVAIESALVREEDAFP